MAAANVKLRDVGYIWEVFLQAGFYATPIIYPLSMVLGFNEFAAKLLLINPVAQSIQDARYFFVTEDSTTMWQLTNSVWYIGAPFIIIVLVAVLGAWYFKKSQGRFAEEV